MFGTAMHILLKTDSSTHARTPPHSQIHCMYLQGWEGGWGGIGEGQGIYVFICICEGIIFLYVFASGQGIIFYDHSWSYNVPTHNAWPILPEPEIVLSYLVWNKL